MKRYHHCAVRSAMAAIALWWAAGSAQAVTMSWVTVGDPGNVDDSTGYGGVAEAFRIMEFEWTNAQYVDFLNAVDPDGNNPNGVYNPSMESNARGGISFTSGAASGSKYAVKTNMGDKPVIYVSWFDAARVANWLHNGQGGGSTETGAYSLDTAPANTAPAVNPRALYFLPTEDQWYKAAYYKGGSTNAGYWSYATQSDTAPSEATANGVGDGPGSTGNTANVNRGADWDSQNGNVTTVGTNGGPSAYGSFDMTGNVWEWNDLTGGANTSRGLRGGDWASGVGDAASTVPITNSASDENDIFGFRLASAAAVPEPSSLAMLAVGLACGTAGLLRRRGVRGRDGCRGKARLVRSEG